MKLLTGFALVLSCGILPAQTVAHAKGVAHTEQVDIGYETLGAAGTTIPVIAVNGGPGLSHAYMVQNDMWERVAGKRMVVFYEERGPGTSKRGLHGAQQPM